MILWFRGSITYEIESRNQCSIRNVPLAVYIRYVVDPEVDSTNNRAERALRPAVIYRKTSSGSRSNHGANAYARLHSIFYTTKLRKGSFIRDVPGMIRSRESHPG